MEKTELPKRHAEPRAQNPDSNPLSSRPCECGSHVFALPWHKERVAWRKANESPMREIYVECGTMPEEPRPLPHVIIVSAEDAYHLNRRRWRVWSTSNRRPHRFQVSGRKCGQSLAELILPDREVVEFKNLNGADCRRENLWTRTMAAIRDDINARRREKRRRAKPSS